MKKNLLILLFFFLQVSFSQENIIIIDYTHHIHMKELPSATIVDARLTFNDTVSNYEMDFVGNLNFEEEKAGKEGGSVYAIKAKKNPHIFKNFIEKKINSIERVSMKPFYVKDTMNIFDWKIDTSKREILGYKCQKAKTHFRGREYIAYFTLEIPYPTGPWKFYGLPGVILSVESTDKVFKMNANQIVIKKTNETISNPFDEIDLKPITWESYIKEYEKKYYELKNYRGENGTTRSLPKKKIETIILETAPYIKD